MALFASLFAILQPREEGDDGQTSPGPDAGLETVSPGDASQQVDIARSSRALPAGKAHDGRVAVIRPQRTA